MNKILLVIKREYLVRVRKKSFIIMTILGPLLLAALMIAPIYLANQSQERRIIAVNQQTDFLLSDTELIHFVTIPDYEVDSLKKKFKNNQYYALLNIVNEEFTMYSDLQISLNVVRDIENQIEKIIELNNLKKAGIEPQILEDAKKTYDHIIIDSAPTKHRNYNKTYR